MKGTSIAFGIAVSLATIVGACDDGNPTPENTVRPSAIPVHSLTGVVTEPVAVAVEGAAVTVLDGPYKGKSTITDGAGSYALIGLEGGFTIQVTKDGYASEARGVTYLQTSPSMSKSGRLSSMGTSVATGQSRSSHIPAVKAR